MYLGEALEGHHLNLLYTTSESGLYSLVRYAAIVRLSV
jgi:hypothetical protein